MSEVHSQPQICRLCLALTNTSFSLLEAGAFSEMLEALTSLKILPSDEISTVMCLKCSLNLKLAFRIQRNMLKAQQRFHERLSVVVKSECDAESAKIEVPEQPPEHAKKLIYTCDICGKQKSSHILLNKHKYNVHQTVDCPKCPEKIARTSFKRHVSSHDLVRPKVNFVPKEESPEHVCDVCGKSQLSAARLKKHKRNMHVFKECPTCLQQVLQTNLSRHVEAHKKRLEKEALKAKQDADAKTVEYPCDMCEKKLSSQSTLRRHKYIVHVTGECPICKKQISKVNLKRHIERHSDPLVVCELCGLSYKQHDLRYHHYNAHRSRSFKCDFCDKVFRSRLTKSDHEKRHHLGEANFVCDTCGKKFYKSVNLKKHIASTHLKLRPHVCETCNVGFSSKFALKTHHRQHTNEKPFRCEFCGEGFRQNVSLKSHLKSQHAVEEELNCECKECGKKFASSAALLSHERVHK